MAEKEKIPEKENKGQVSKKKKSARGGFLLILILLLIIAVLAALLFFDPFGWGMFGKGGSGGQSAGGQGTETAAQTAALTAEQTTEAAPVTVYIDVRISGATYLYNGAESTADSIVAAAKAAEGDEIIVRLKDDSATENAVKDLRAALDKENIKWIME